MREYVTRQGDEWDMIAYRVYPEFGRERLMSVLIAANEEYAEYVKFPAGIVLKVPEADYPVVDNLPPWVRD